MTRHDWKPAPSEYAPLWKELEQDIIVKLQPNYDMMCLHEVYTCSRCGDDARVYVKKTKEGIPIAGEGGASMNWNSDCDESIVRKTHES